ncbi:putative signal transducing protein [Lysobacter fragariae]
MKVVYEAANLIDAHLVRHALEAAEIPVFLRGEQLIGGMGELPLFGVIAVCVPEIVWPQARDIVAMLPLNEPSPADDALGNDALGDEGWLPA